MKFLKEDELYILNYAFKTRLVFLSLIIVSNWLFPDHEPTDVFETPLARNSSSSFVDKVVLLCFKGVTHWDAQHFYHISHYGYTYENNLAFFPLFPAILSVISKVFITLFSPYVSYFSAVILSSVLINFALFVLTAIVFYRLTFNVFRNLALAKKAALFFCISPASVFFISGYSETLYSFLSFSGMLQMISGKLTYSSIYFALAAGCRSNGIVNIGFLVHNSILCLCNIYSMNSSFKSHLIKYLSVVLELCFGSFLIVSPYIIFQVYSYLLFCTPPRHSLDFPSEVIKYSVSQKLVLPKQGSVWCNYTLPLAYSYVQEKYWNVGFLKYYVLKQIPNFILAFPIIFTLTVYTIVCLKYYMPFKNLIRSVYLQNSRSKGCATKHTDMMPKDEFAFVIHAFALTVFCAFFINIQVTTRLLCSSSPILYWVTARFFLGNEKSTKPSLFSKTFPFCVTSNFIVGKLLKKYFLVYSVLGTILFSNNYPWT